MSSNAGIGYGGTFEISTDAGSTWDEIAEITNIGAPAFAIDTHDTTHMQSPEATREFIAGLMDTGECPIESNFLPGSDSEALILSIRRLKVLCRITWPNGSTMQFAGILTGYAPAAPIDDKMTATTTFKVSGVVTYGDAAAPVNSVAPAISGVAQVGQVLTAYPGKWSGGPAYAYVWKNEGVALSGATHRTYTLQASDSGDTITVTVTATNSAGSASATSAGLADIAA